MATKIDGLSVRLFELATTCATGAAMIGCSGCNGAAPSPSQSGPQPVIVPPASSHDGDGSEPAAGQASPPRSTASKICPDADWEPLNQLKPAESHDYVAIMERTSGGSAAPAQVRWATGEPCSSESQRKPCLKALERLAATVTEGRIKSGQISSQHYLVTTKGERVELWTSREDWLRFLGEIDTPQEALLLAWYDLYEVQCAEPASGGYQVTGTRMTRDCAPIEITEYALRVSARGQVVVEGSKVIKRSGACVGRRPEGLLPARGAGGPNPVAAFFADVAHLEGAAVMAFRNMSEELQAFGAPPALIAQAERAASDEVRHARLMGRLAMKLGAVPAVPAVAAAPARSLSEAAMDNAVEGCVRETFGALVGTVQSLNAKNRSVRRLLRDIASDERRHAALSWQLHHWFDGKLPPHSDRSLRQAQLAAVAQLREEWADDPEPSLMAEAGLPSSEVAGRLLDGIERHLLG